MGKLLLVVALSLPTLPACSKAEAAANWRNTVTAANAPNTLLADGGSDGGLLLMNSDAGIAGPSDGGVRSYIAPSYGTNLAVQCPGYQILYKTESPTSYDGGIGTEAELIDFIADPHRYPIPLRTYEDRVYFRNVDAGVFECHTFDVR